MEDLKEYIRLFLLIIAIIFFGYNFISRIRGGERMGTWLKVGFLFIMLAGFFVFYIVSIVTNLRSPAPKAPKAPSGLIVVPQEEKK